MYVETYRDKEITKGEYGPAIPYPKLSENDFNTWRRLLPIRAFRIPLMALESNSVFDYYNTYGLPSKVAEEICIAGKKKLFNSVEIWSARHLDKDPIAIGITKSGDRYLIVRWGFARLLPFTVLKRRLILVDIWNVGARIAIPASVIFGLVYWINR